MRYKEENIRIKFKKDNTFAVIITSAIIITIMIIGVKLGASSVYATSGDEIANMASERQILVEKNKSLETQIAQAQSIPHIEKEATLRLGMVKAKSIIYLNIDANK